MWCRCVGKSRNPGAWRNSLHGLGASRARQADSHLEGTEDGVSGAAGPSVHACLGEAIGNAHEWGCIRSRDEGGTSTFHHEMMGVWTAALHVGACIPSLFSTHPPEDASLSPRIMTHSVEKSFTVRVERAAATTASPGVWARCRT